MALPRSYLTSSKNLPHILEAIKSAQAPDKFTIKFLESLDFKSTADRLIIGVLKSIGFLSPDAKPTERYFRFLDQTQSGAVLAEGIRDAYSDLFQVNVKAQNLSQSEVINKLKTLGQGQFSESVLDKMAMTFAALSRQADFSESTPQRKQGEPVEVETPPVVPVREEAGLASKLSYGGLHYNIQVILPETRDPKVYDAIFRSLREHLV